MWGTLGHLSKHRKQLIFYSCSATNIKKNNNNNREVAWAFNLANDFREQFREHSSLSAVFEAREMICFLVQENQIQHPAFVFHELF